jgi:hypothetical protein
MKERSMLFNLPICAADQAPALILRYLLFARRLEAMRCIFR